MIMMKNGGAYELMEDEDGEDGDEFNEEDDSYSC